MVTLLDPKAHTVIKIAERAAFAKVIDSQIPSSFQKREAATGKREYQQRVGVSKQRGLTRLPDRLVI